MRKLLILCGIVVAGCSGVLSDDRVQRALEIIREQEGCARVGDPKDPRFEYEICRSRVQDAGR